MIDRLRSICELMKAILREGDAQNVLEYLLVLGGAAIAMAAILSLGFDVLVPQVVGHICPSVDTGVNPISQVGACIHNF